MNTTSLAASPVSHSSSWLHSRSGHEWRDTTNVEITTAPRDAEHWATFAITHSHGTLFFSMPIEHYGEAIARVNVRHKSGFLGSEGTQTAARASKRIQHQKVGFSEPYFLQAGTYVALKLSVTKLTWSYWRDSRFQLEASVILWDFVVCKSGI